MLMLILTEYSLHPKSEIFYLNTIIIITIATVGTGNWT